MKKFAIAFGISLLIQGCTYAISPEMTKQADRTLTFQQLQADPDTFKGKIIILGGIIAQTSTTKQGTIIEIIEKPLDYWGKPKRTDKTGGRFLVVHVGDLDPIVFGPGREITVAAEIEGTRSKALGDIEYDYPVVVSKELKLWERERQSWDRPQWIDPLYDPYSPRRFEQ
ncbi:MAG TPA: Slp family lipoprotein [Nitrospirota bacterium]|nr:Slp family lipoprotein [Nitrospirota bacterium]